ncbi:MAG: DoxX family protein [Verrucomicrobiia bacterium]|jgi:hypothetical protein
MEFLIKAIQVVVALGIINVWVFRFEKATAWRGGSARNLKEEFATYGLPAWFMVVVGCLKVTFAVLLIAALWSPRLLPVAGGGIAILMLGAVLMHVKVRDPLKKSAPAAMMLALSLATVFLP